MEEYAAALAAAVRERREPLFELARRVVDTTMDGRYSDDELRQLLHGFEAMILELLEGRGTETRDFLIETAIPGVVAAGDTSATIVRAVATWAVLMSTELAAGVPASQRDASAEWLAGFFGDYAERVLAAARQAEGSA